MSTKEKLVCGIGTNDADYVVDLRAVIGGKSRRLWICPFYRAWANMLKRCYNRKYQAAKPTYVGCSVASEWHVFSAFRGWMASQGWEGNHLDKDVMVPGNKVYGPDTSVFVSPELNAFLTDRGASRGEWPIGVCGHKQRGKFQSRCRNPFTGKNDFLGLFTRPNEAHLAWAAKKLEHAITLGAEQTDPRVAKAIIDRFTAIHRKALDTLTVRA